MNLALWQLIVAVAAATGIPSGITGLCFWHFQRKIEKQNAEREAQEQAREALELLNVKGTLAAITLAEATARAVQRIPDTHCNGDMSEALEYAKDIKHSVREFLARQATKAVIK